MRGPDTTPRPPFPSARDAGPGEANHGNFGWVAPVAIATILTYGATAILVVLTSPEVQVGAADVIRFVLLQVLAATCGFLFCGGRLGSNSVSYDSPMVALARGITMLVPVITTITALAWLVAAFSGKAQGGGVPGAFAAPFAILVMMTFALMFGLGAAAEMLRLGAKQKKIETDMQRIEIDMLRRLQLDVMDLQWRLEGRISELEGGVAELKAALSKSEANTNVGAFVSDTSGSN